MLTIVLCFALCSLFVCLHLPTELINACRKAVRKTKKIDLQLLLSIVVTVHLRYEAKYLAAVHSQFKQQHNLRLIFPDEKGLDLNLQPIKL